jgi:sodium-dependent dicarboxylate transporter 2/3/5
MIYLGCFTIIALLTLVMAHTAVAATVFPLLMAVHSLYQEDNQPTRFGKGLFIGMAFSAGAASIVSLLGSARGALTVGFFHEMTGSEISFTQYSLYLLPLGWGMVLLIWFAMMLFFKPERPAIPGLKQRANDLVARLGPISRSEAFSLIVVLSAVALLCCCSCLASWKFMDRTGIALLAALSLFLLKILNLQDLEEIPWNIVLLLGGAMSLGLCLWQTGAAAWLAVQAVALFQYSSWFVFVMILGFLVMVTANIIMNVAAVAFYTPVALAMAPYMGVSSELVLFTILTTAGMPFMLLIGAAPNAIAYESGQFSPREFLKIGMPISLLLMIMLGVFILFIWPLLGMPGPVRH